MYKDEIKDTRSKIREYNWYFFNECLWIYIKLLFIFPKNKELRRELCLFANNYYAHSKLEKEILLHINNYFGNDDEVDECEEVLEQLDEIFFRYFNYNEYILEGYSDAIETREPLRATICDRKFDFLDDENKNQILKNLVKANKKD